jgi:hypothetical protein
MAHPEVGKGSASRGVGRFLFVRRECSLAGTIFSSGFLVVQPVTGKIPCVKTTLPVEYPSAEPLCRGALSSLGFCFQVAHASQLLHVALL